MNVSQYNHEANHTDTAVYYNVTNQRSTTSVAMFLEEPTTTVIVYVLLLFCGSALNSINVLTLIRSQKNGVLALILQISLVDSCSLYVAITETLALYYNTWYFPAEFCPVFKGTEILVNTLIVYLIICFNFHVVSIWNLHETELKKSNKNPLTACDADPDDSIECLVTKHENANRLVTIDYRKRKEEISVMFPAILIWIVGLSLSVPNFSLSSTLKLKSNDTICAVVDTYYGEVLQYSLLIFKIVLPVVLLFLTLIILMRKLNQTSESGTENMLTKKTIEIRRLLMLGLMLSSFYLLTSLQRHCLHFLHIASYFFKNNTVNSFRTPPLYNIFLSGATINHLAVLHYSGSAIRGLLYFASLPKFLQLVKSKIFICCKVEV